MPAQLILMNPSRPGRARAGRAGGTKLGAAVRRALDKAAGRRGNPATARQMRVAQKFNASGKHQKGTLTPRRVENLIQQAVMEEQRRARVRKIKADRAAKKAAKQAAGSPRTINKEKHMARKKKSARRSNPSRKHVSRRRNPDAPKTRKPRVTKAARLGKLAQSGAFSAEQVALIMSTFGAGPKKTRKPGVKRVKLTEAQKIARRESRKAANKGFRATAKGAVLQAFKAMRAGQISPREYGALIGAGRKGQKRAASRYAKMMRKPATRTSAELYGPTHVRAFAWKNQTAKKSAGRKMANLYLTVKRKLKLETDPTARLIAKQLGLTSIPNAGGIKGVISDLKATLPMAAFAAGGIALVGWGVSKAIPWVESKVSPEYKKYLVPGMALVVGLGGAAVMKKYKGLAKYSGAVAVGGVAIATMAVLNSSAWAGADGKTLASKIAPGVLSLGDYHMGLSVGDYHMGGRLNVGDYHMGDIEEVNARRQLAPAGQPMPRHDTRRDGVDSSIDQFNGTLAGDIFDQN